VLPRMAQVVLGLGSSHSPQVNMPSDSWKLLRHKDETDTRMDYQALLSRAGPEIESQLTEACWRDRGQAVEHGVSTLGEQLRNARPDVVVIFGDDQHEQFLDDNLPMLAIYHGRELPVSGAHQRANPSTWKLAEESRWAETQATYPAGWELAEHLIGALAEAEFDVARANRLREDVGVGHAFSFLYRRLWPGTQVPIVPIMVNTYFPPNQPTPGRCYALGRAVRRAIESWASNARVAIMASGGLSHVIMDEALDRQVLDALEGKDVAALRDLPRAQLKGGTSEILNWVAVAGAMEAEPMHLVEYVPGYRSPAATGCGMAFAYWQD
jgi:catalytic LigB subunit of aromatic ring-opening dioxygenase